MHKINSSKREKNILKKKEMLTKYMMNLNNKKFNKDPSVYYKTLALGTILQTVSK